MESSNNLKLSVREDRLDSIYHVRVMTGSPLLEGKSGTSTGLQLHQLPVITTNYPLYFPRESFVSQQWRNMCMTSVIGMDDDAVVTSLRDLRCEVELPA